MMGAAPSEPCIYEKLADSVEVLRQSGERYGMSERDIERFIAQILETNEPQREAVRHPRLMTAAKVVVALGLLITAIYSIIIPYGRSHCQSAVTEDQSWRSPIISHIRLFCLPIAKKYNLEAFQDWECSGCARLIPNCTECAALTTVGTVNDMKHISKYNHRIVQPVVIKSGPTMSLSYEDLKHLYSEYKEVMDVYADFGDDAENEANKNSYLFPEEESNLIVHWKKQRINGIHILRMLFPNSSILPFESKVSLKKCIIAPSRGSPFQLLNWDKDLEEIAVEYAQKCIWGHNKDRGRTGENLYAVTGLLNLQEAVEKWHLEVEFYTYETMECAPKKLCGHYTQLVWADSDKEGCDSHICEELQGLDYKNVSLLVCNYLTPGNVIGQYPYKEGIPCSECPDGTKCVDKLCSNQVNNGNLALSSCILTLIMLLVLYFAQI
ncbi:bombesin receptor-activated protein C6orf89 homolog isoform X2 [Rhincodon typus]|uniref:bombesin receptor-activated protein C6orf89 homolog isoform X2 n=1 Tax=Rhincodon typus TaxID=259920 RepID=UPI00202FD535|nr:bombesin receptor-activated protein C6orf89 homolog isoform X2 [Rhincodon typus]